jgi:hypothetical protein
MDEMAVFNLPMHGKSEARSTFDGQQGRVRNLRKH